MSERIKCKDCKWYEQGRALCHRVAPCVLPSLTDSRTYFSLFPCTAQDEYCGMAEKKEDDSCNPESTEYQHQVKINTLEDKIEFLKDTQRVIIQSLKNDCRQFSTSGGCRMYHHGCNTNCPIFQLIVKYNIP